MRRYLLAILGAVALISTLLLLLPDPLARGYRLAVDVWFMPVSLPCSKNKLHRDEILGLEILSLETPSDHDYHFTALVTNRTDEPITLTHYWRLGARYFCAWAYPEPSTLIDHAILSMDGSSLDGVVLAPGQAVIAEGRMNYKSYRPSFCHSSDDVRLELATVGPRTKLKMRGPIPTLVSRPGVCDLLDDN